MTRENVQVKPGHEYDHYFPEAKVGRILKKRNAKVSDTLKLIPAIIRETAWQTRRFAHEVIKADTLEKTCSNLWHFVYDHIAYKKDETGKEQVRDAARIWHDRHNFDPVTGEPMGCDCDCMTTFICSVLYNLEVKSVFFRVTRYEEPHWEHIYPVVKLPNGKEIIIDCVLHHFNQEAKYTAKQDTAMDLEYLNGVTDSTMSRLSDAPDLMGIMDEQEALSALGKIFKKKASGGGGGSKPAKKGLFKKKAAGAPKKPLFKKKTAEQKKATKAKVKKFIGKGLHVTNRINPVTVALRNGVLAGMKLNFLKIAENLRWAYLTPEQAQAKGADMSKYQKLKGVREKLEKIFHGAGGKPENLKKAILTGRGNRDKAVPLNGLGYIAYENVDGLNEDMPLNQLLGHEIYYSENVQGLEGLDGFEGLEGFSQDADLGAATAASVAAASTVLTTIAGLIKSIGSLFPGKAAAKGGASKKENRKAKKAAKRGGGESTGDEGGGSGDSSESGGESESSESESGGGSEAEGGGAEAGAESGGEENSGGSEDAGSGAGDKSSEESSDEGGSTNGNSESAAAKGSGEAGGGLKASTLAKAKQFWESNKKWIKPTGIAVGVLGLVYLTHRILKSNSAKKPALGLTGIGKKQKRKSPKKKNILSGIRSKKGGKRPASKQHKKRKVITLL
jgi:hypothetical protein